MNLSFANDNVRAAHPIRAGVIAFEVGKTYGVRSICDHECVFRYTIAKRTDKTVTFTNGKRAKISVYSGAETCAPQGRYSMAPILSATDEGK